MARNTNTDLAILEIAVAMKKLIDNPNLEKTVSDAYTLSEAQEKEYEAAMEVIATASEIKASIAQERATLANIDERIAEAKKIEDFNADTLVEIRKEKSDIAKAADKNASDSLAIEKAVDEIEAIKADLDSRKEALDEKEAALIEYEARLNKAASAAQNALKDF